MNIALKKQLRDDAYDEIDVLESLNHQNVVTYFGFKNEGIHTYMALELCASSLHDKLSTSEYCQGFPEHETIKCMLDFMCGYRYIRSMGIIHGDIKTKNILVDFDGNYKLADFGLSQYAEDDDELQYFCGSYSYCHPVLFEVLEWKNLHPLMSKPRGRSYPATAEVWSIAVLFFVIADGSLPFVANSSERMFHLISGKANGETCGYEIPNDGRIARGTYFPHRVRSDMFIELAGIVASMLEVNIQIRTENSRIRFSANKCHEMKFQCLLFNLQPRANRLPSFQQFFSRVNDFLTFWRRYYN